MKPLAFWCMTSVALGGGGLAGCGGANMDKGPAGNVNDDAAATADGGAGDGRIRRDGTMYVREIKEDGGGVWTNGSDVPISAPGADMSPSCVGLPANCGQTGGETCCISLLIPGGTYNRSFDVKAPATLTDFRLDRYEVTVGRFRKFIEAGQGTQAGAPAPDSGANPRAGGSGWSSPWNASLVTDGAALKEALKCNPRFHTWTDAPGEHETRPINCVTWYEAFAFCAWDGGWLPTETEWDYAAAGGNQQRVFPFSVPAKVTEVDDDQAVFCGNSCGTTQNVGAKSPKGDARGAQADMAGNVWEWTLDWFAPYVVPCTDCANTTDSAGKSLRVLRGGGFGSPPGELATYIRPTYPPDARYPYLGVRCARKL